MVAALAAGGTFSFEPEPDEEELLPRRPGGRRGRGATPDPERAGVRPAVSTADAATQPPRRRNPDTH